MLIFLYTILWAILLLLFWIPALIWGLLRGESIHDRIGLWRDFPKNPIWIHASSMGETAGAIALAKELKKLDLPIVMTATTLSGFKQLKRNAPSGVSVHLQPIDFMLFLCPLFRKIHPRALIILESDMWLGMLDSARKNGAKVIVVSGKLSEKTVRYSKIFPFYFNAIWKRVDKIFTRTEKDLKSFKLAGAPAEMIEVIGDLKLSALDTGDLIKLEKPKRFPIIIWGSIRSAEESLAIETILAMREKFPDALTIIAPRHQDRFDEVARLLEQNSLKYSRRSLEEEISDNVSVFLLDTMGELAGFYSIADIAVIGGTFANYGGHNPLEPAVQGVPVIHGPDTKNNSALFTFLDENDVAFGVDSDKISDKILELCADKVYLNQVSQQAQRLTKNLDNIAQRYTEKIITEISTGKEKL